MHELWRLSACELAEGIRDRRFTCVQVMESVLGRVQARNPALNAIVYDYSEQALTQARAADRHVAEGHLLGEMHGVPVTIKENVDVRGTPTPNGVPALESIIAPDDAPVVRNLRNAGAIVIGRTNTPEVSMRATTDNPLHGRTLNPWHADASPGGSSGGAGAAAAAGFGPVHHGNDIGGSLRFPSFACGVATVKPTLGRVPAYNPSATVERGLLAQLMSVQGVICREVRDVDLATRVLSAEDPRDPWWVPVPFDGPPDAQPINVAFTRDAHGYPMHPEIGDALARAAGFLSDAGYAVEEIATPPILEAARCWQDIATFEIEATLGPLVREHGSGTIQRIFGYYRELGELVDERGYREGIAARTALTRAWNVFLQDHPLVLSPFLMRPTYAWDYDARGSAQTKDLFSAAMYSLATNFLSLPCGVVPIGLVDALPAGVQLIGRRYREDLILGAMQAIEDRVGVLSHRLWDEA